MSCNSTADHSFFGYWEVKRLKNEKENFGKAVFRNNSRSPTRSTRVSRRISAWTELNSFLTSPATSFGSMTYFRFKSCQWAMTSNRRPQFGRQNQWWTMRSQSTARETNPLTFCSAARHSRLLTWTATTWTMVLVSFSDPSPDITSSFEREASIRWNKWRWTAMVGAIKRRHADSRIKFSTHFRLVHIHL